MVFLIALFGMVCWGIAPVFGKLGLAKVDPLAALALRTYISTGFITIWVMRSGIINHIKHIQPKAMVFLGLEGLLAAFIGDLAYYIALKYGDVSFVTLVMSCSPVISTIAAVLFLHEEITIARLIGSFFVIIGIMLVMK